MVLHPFYGCYYALFSAKSARTVGYAMNAAHAKPDVPSKTKR